MVLAEQTANFEDLTTRVRINPHTRLTFEGDDQVTLTHQTGEKGVQIKYDIMLILYNMVEWTTVAELCEGWPEGDQQLIKDHLAMLYESRVIITDDSELYEPTPGDLPENLGKNITINVENHHVMLRDSIRMACYQRAIEHTVGPDNVVMDLGAGSGILSFFSARAGAKKVYSVERRPDMVMLAKELAKANGFEERITFVQNSSHMVKPEDLGHKPDVLVAEILGNAILEENVLEFTMDVRDRLLAPGAKLIPGSLDIYVAAFDAGPLLDRTQEVTELEDIYGFNLGMLKQVLGQKATTKLERFNPLLVTMMSEPVNVMHLDLATIESPTFKTSFTFDATQDGFVNGFVAYFKAHMSEDNVLTNSPWAPPTHWTQMVYYFPTRKAVEKGQTVDMEMLYDGGLGLWFKEDYPDAE